MWCQTARCLKITEKVSFNIASYVYILSGQKFTKNAQRDSFWRVFQNLKLAVKHCYQTGHFLQDNNWWKMPKFKYDILGDFQTLCVMPNKTFLPVNPWVQNVKTLCTWSESLKALSSFLIWLFQSSNRKEPLDFYEFDRCLVSSP